MSLRQRDAWAGVLFAAPQTAGFIVFTLGPLLAIVWFSLRDWNVLAGESTFVGLANYELFVRDPEVFEVAVNTLVFTLGLVPLTVLTGLALAVAVNHHLPEMRLLRTLYFLPVVISLSAWTIAWRLLLQPEGPINAGLTLIGQQPLDWLRQPQLAMASVIGVQFFKTVGYAMVLFLAGLQSIPGELRDAARVDGASDPQAFQHVVFPLLAPFTFLAMVLVTITSLKSFTLIYLLTGGGPGSSTTVIGYYIYRNGLQLFEFGFASALAVALFTVVLVLTIVQFRLRRRWVFHEE